ncbi:CHRD domain-containing protein [Leptolyngbya sp. FACHB-261]|uniref:CHRD domain-containing protein n=1 Tax=Leptolyngbya sp. FACHB-261 TaxID=2692806 RepID=UPI0016873F14|nr:CHRD domain-containing protein [Leptolyngbya sp. FACHB-261]MBD2101873.1 CHRD domain-containing protein [Leptolyngbya sp. FACHB-261]
MQRLWTASLLGAVLTLLSPIAAHAATFTFSTPLSGEQQVPPNSSSASGLATSILDGEPTAWTFRYDLSFSGLSGPLALAHIHVAPLGQAGPVVHDLDSPPIGSTSGRIAGDWTSAEVVAAGVDPSKVFNRFLAGQYYFNIHSNAPGTTFLTGGEIRGQIEDPMTRSVPEPSSMLAVLALGAFSAGSVLKRAKVAG